MKHAMLSAALLPGPHEIQRTGVCGAIPDGFAAGAAGFEPVVTLTGVGVSEESLSVVTMLLRQANASPRQRSRPRLSTPGLRSCFL